MTQETSSERRASAPPARTSRDAALLERLREEARLAPENGNQSLLLHEVGVLHERLGEEPVAARDFLAAFNADVDFREPLEALVRILSRRKSHKNLAKLLDAMAKNAPSPKERARALREAAVVQIEQNAPDEARARLEEAITEDPDDLAAWLELERIGAETNDVPLVTRAIEARLPLIGDDTYKAILCIQLAELAAKDGQTQRAYEILDGAAALEGRSRFQTRLCLERIAYASADLDALARALEGQAELCAEVLDDPTRGEEIGIPKAMRSAAFAADAWLRAAEIRKRLGEVEVAAGLLHQAALRLSESSTVMRARLGTLELTGDLEGAATIARAELERSDCNLAAAALWLRVAEANAVADDRDGALQALGQALANDPGAVAARAIQIDLLLDGEEPARLAEAFEGLSETVESPAAKARAWTLASWVWAASCKNATRARAALAKAHELGVETSVWRRAERLLATLAEDADWALEASRGLLDSATDPERSDLVEGERAELLFEIGRAAFLAGDHNSAAESFSLLGETEGQGPFAKSRWIGTMLAATLLSGGEEPGARPANLALRLAEIDEERGRAWRLIAAIRCVLLGETEAAIVALEGLLEEAPQDEVVALTLSELLRENPGQAATPLLRSADAATGAGAALFRMEAALLLWVAGQRERAVNELEAAATYLPDSAEPLLVWARRGLSYPTLEARRLLLDSLEPFSDPGVIRLERATTELAMGPKHEHEAARAAFTSVLDLGEASDDLKTAAALGSLIVADETADRAAFDRAAAELDEVGGDGIILSRFETYRVARDVDQDPAAAVAAAERWAEAEPTGAVGLEWLTAAVMAEDRTQELNARTFLADVLEAESLAVSSATIALLDLQTNVGPLAGTSPAVCLMNLELAPPGTDPAARAEALASAAAYFDAEGALDASLLAGFCRLRGREFEAAIPHFKVILDERPEDLAAWEGMRQAAEGLGRPIDLAIACAELGALSVDDARGAAFWETAGLALLEHTDAHEDAEIALDRAFARDARASKAFDKLFRRVRERKEHKRLITLIDRRLEVCDDEKEIGKLFWERARTLQALGDHDGALAALENVTMLEPDHVGALALSGTICIQKGDFRGAAEQLSALSKNKEAPKQERLVSGLTACDLFENKLSDPKKSLDVLLQLQREGLSTPTVRERLAKAATKAGDYAEATSMLETLMEERTTSSGRVDAARLAMVIWRDKRGLAESSERAVAKLLEEVPDDPEALELVLQTPFSEGFRVQVLARGKQALVHSLERDPRDVDRVALLSRIAVAQGDWVLRQATLGVLVALGKPDRGLTDELTQLEAKISGRPHTAIDGRALTEIADPRDTGPLSKLFVAIAETVSLTLGPTLDSLKLGRKNRLDPKAGLPLRLAVSEWMGALGFDVEFEIYVSGPGTSVRGLVDGETPALVLGSDVKAPFDAPTRAAVAREVFALRRGLSSVLGADPTAVACVAIAVCNELGAGMPNPNYALYSKFSRDVHKEMSRKVRKAATELAIEVARSGQDPEIWAMHAQASCDRMAAIAAGDVSVLLAEYLETPRNDLGAVVKESARAQSLLRFALSPAYLDVRKKLGMGVVR